MDFRTRVRALTDTGLLAGMSEGELANGAAIDRSAEREVGWGSRGEVGAFYREAGSFISNPRTRGSSDCRSSSIDFTAFQAGGPGFTRVLRNRVSAFS